MKQELINNTIKAFEEIKKALQKFEQRPMGNLAILKEEILNLKNNIIEFSALANEIIESAKETEEISSSSEKPVGENYEAIKEKLEAGADRVQFGKSQDYAMVVSHLAEIMEELNNCQRVMQQIDFIQPERYISALVNVKVGLKDHILAHHIDDLSKDSPGIITCINKLVG